MYMDWGRNQSFYNFSLVLGADPLQQTMRGWCKLAKKHGSMGGEWPKWLRNPFHLPPSSSSKWKFIGIPYGKCNNPGISRWWLVTGRGVDLKHPKCYSGNLSRISLWRCGVCNCTNLQPTLPNLHSHARAITCQKWTQKRCGQRDLIGLSNLVVSSWVFSKDVLSGSKKV